MSSCGPPPFLWSRVCAGSAVERSFMARLLTMILAWALAVLGGFFAIAGGVLVAVGGSPYYVITGILMVVSGALLGRGKAAGWTLFIAI